MRYFDIGFDITLHVGRWELPLEFKFAFNPYGNAGRKRWKRWIDFNFYSHKEIGYGDIWRLWIWKFSFSVVRVVKRGR